MKAIKKTVRMFQMTKNEVAEVHTALTFIITRAWLAKRCSSNDKTYFDKLDELREMLGSIR